ncbi:MAG: MFS transporter [Sciscionella sp.]
MEEASQAVPTDSAGARPSIPDVLAAPDAAPEGLEGHLGGAARPVEVASSRRRLIFGVVAIGLFMVSVDQTIVATALPAIEKELHATVNWSGWTITIYSVGQVLVMSLAGKMSDRFGPKRVLIGSVALFTTASLCCGLATSMYMLVALRLAQAAGGGSVMPSASGIVSEHFGQDRDRALGMFSSIFPIGAVVGPILGGVFVSEWSWRVIFLVNVPVGVVLITLAFRFVPRNSPKAAAGTDPFGLTLLGLCLLPAMLGISYLGMGGAQFDSLEFIAAMTTALVAGSLFVRHIRRHPSPVIPPQFLLDRKFRLINLINFIYGAAALGFTALVPLYAEERYDLHPLEAGTLLTARGAGMIALSGLAVWALRRTGYRLPMIVGFSLAAGSLVMLAVAPPVLSPYPWMALAAGITGVGLGVANPASNNASLQLAPDNVTANAGIRGMSRQAGSVLAVSVTTAVMAQSAQPGLVLGHAFLFFAALLVATIPFVTRIQDHRGRW